jgi:[ribosomal protein S5]-alanine N-acetyltransferase
VVLRRPEAGEDEACGRCYGEAVAGAGRPISREIEQSFGAFMVEHWRRYRFGFYVLELLGGSDMIGHCGFRYQGASPGGCWPEHFSALELGYALKPEFVGHGYATEAAVAAIAAAFAAFDVPSVIARCRLDNPASARVLERCGMLEEATQEQRHFRIARLGGQGTSA